MKTYDFKSQNDTIMFLACILLLFTSYLAFRSNNVREFYSKRGFPPKSSTKCLLLEKHTEVSNVFVSKRGQIFLTLDHSSA